jgi:DNA-binding MarR family transcriptional regulator
MASHIIDDTNLTTARPTTERRGADADRRRTAAAHQISDMRVALDAFRHIVQALRASGGDPSARLGSAQRFALQQIAEHPGASINDIAALTFTHQSSVSVVIQRLVDQQLVAKAAAADDRRRQRLTVTAKGRRELSRAPVAAQGALIAAIASLPDADRRVLAKSLHAVARLMTPHGRTVNPPMFFEDRPGSQDKAAAGRRRGR